MNMPELQDKRKYLLRIIVDFVCLAVVGLPVLIYFKIGAPFKRGFYCDDDSIRYPYKDSTVTNVVLYCVGISGPIIVISITETIRSYKLFGEKNFAIKLLWDIYRIVWIFGFGSLVSQLTTDIAKYTIGRLRPHFIDICEPNINVDFCSTGHKYITNFHCTNTDAFRVKESRLSFPSGHASFSAYCMVFLAMYLEARMNFKYTKLLKPFIQTIVLLVAFYTALSRVSDYKHHWSDVLAGSFQGTVVAVLIVLYVSDLFTKNTKLKEESSVEEGDKNYE